MGDGAVVGGDRVEVEDAWSPYDVRCFNLNFGPQPRRGTRHGSGDGRVAIGDGFGRFTFCWDLYGDHKERAFKLKLRV